MTRQAPDPRRGRRPGGRALRIVLAGLAAASMVAAAQAYLRSSGAGAGAAGTATVAAVTLAPASVTDPLYPGDTALVSLTAQNNDATEVRIQALSLDTSQGTAGFARSSGSASCGLATFSFTTQTNGGEGWTLAGNSTLAISLPDAVAASTSTVTACQGVTLTVYLKAT